METQDSEIESSMDTSPTFVDNVFIEHSIPEQSSLDSIRHEEKEDDDGNHVVH